MGKVEIRTYERGRSIVFLKTQEKFGGLSNMAGGFPIIINGTKILTSEALYQACRFPHLPDIQKLIVSQTSPMTAKMRSKPFREQSRPDWMRVRVRIMRWCLSAKLLQNWSKFSSLLLETGDSPIVEQSRTDMFWGAVPEDDSRLVGANVLGRLLMELREGVKKNTIPSRVPPLHIDDFNIFGCPIEIVNLRETTEPFQHDTLF